MLRKFVSGSLAVTALLTLLVIGGCGGGGLYGSGSTMMNPGGGFTTSAAIMPNGATIAVGGTQQFSPMNQPGITYNWTSSNTSVATINSNGLATGVMAGTTMISFTGTDINSPYSASNPLKITTTPVTLTVTAAGMVMGTAAIGMPLVNAMVTLEDSHGQQQVAMTDSNGRFMLAASGLSVPFLLKAQDNQGRILFGFATSAGVANITPFTDAMLRMWYSVRGTDLVTAFASPAAHPAPDTHAESQLNQTLTTFLATSLSGQNLDPAKFNLVSTPFTANGTGMDHILDNTSVAFTNGGIVIHDTLADGELDVAFTGARGTVRLTTVTHAHQSPQATTDKLVLSAQ